MGSWSLSGGVNGRKESPRFRFWPETVEFALFSPRRVSSWPRKEYADCEAEVTDTWLASVRGGETAPGRPWGIWSKADPGKFPVSRLKDFQKWPSSL